jgi:hypothetical protein
MAKRKVKKSVAARTRTRTITKTVRAKSRTVSPMKKMIGGALYGAARGTISTFIAPVTSKIPFGQFADELGMLGLSYYAAKGKLGSQFKEIGTAGLYIESAVLGNALARGGLQTSGVKTTVGGGF